MRKVLIPVDGSRNAMRALDYVLGLAGDGELSVLLIYVHFVPPFFEDTAAYLRRSENRRLADKCARAALGAAGRRLSRAGIEHQEIVRWGDAAPEIARAAVRSKCQAIVMGSRGMGAIKSLILGSTAAKVLQLATVPVTIVK